MQIHNRWIDSNQLLHIEFLGRRSDIFETVSSGILEGWECEIWPLPLTLALAFNDACCATVLMCETAESNSEHW